MPQHFKLGASSCKRWMNCPGSINFIASQPSFLLDLDSEFASDGDEAHEIARKCLETGKDARDLTDDDEIYPAVQVYLDEIRSNLHEDTELFVEKRFKLSEDMGGTTDAAIIDHFFGELLVNDYKHGVGVYVDIEENYQLMYYALCLIEYFKSKKKLPKNAKVTLTIIQPRFIGAGPIRKWGTSIDYLEKVFKPKLMEGAKRAKTSKELFAGDHCRFCPATAVCPAFKGLVLKQYYHPSLAENLKMAENLSQWLKSLEKVCYQTMMNGVKVPGFKLVEGRGQRRFKDEAAVIEELKDNIDAFHPMKLKSPAQLEKILGRKFVEERQVRSPGKLKLAKENDKRPEKIQAHIDFKDIIFGDGNV